MPWEPYEDSRRLTGCNVYFAGSGAALETARGVAVDDGMLQCWRDGVALARSWLHWYIGAELLRAHRSGVSLAFEAPIDQLYAATEVNEWAWWRAVASAGIAAPGGDGLFYAPAHACTWDDDSALHTLRAVAAAQALPALPALRDAARAHGVAFLPDDDVVSIGGGAGSVTWPIEALPAPGDIDWSAVHDVPTALVTGSNGKTTTTRLLAAMCSAHGWRTAWSCTDGVFFEGAALEAGDFSGPTGARTVLRERQAQAAVLETARGGMLRRGLATCAADVAVVTNIAADHFGEYGVHDLDDLADVKLVVAHAVTDGLLVLNADDPVLLRKAASMDAAIAWFALDFEVALARAGGRSVQDARACGVRAGRLLLLLDGDSHDLGAIADMPLTLDGRAQYNIGNIAAAALAATGLGIAPATIAATLLRFGSARGDNPGRLQRWLFGSTEVVVDYAHNPDGLVGLLQAVGAPARRGRLAIALGHAGNRSDEDLRLVAAAAAAFRPELSVLKDSGGYERGRAPGEVAGIMRGELQRLGVPDAAIVQELDEASAARVAVAWAGEGDLVVLPIHSHEARDAVVAMLDAMQATGWRAGDALPLPPPLLPPDADADADADILQRIVARKRIEVADRVARTSLIRIAEAAAQVPPPRGFAAAIEATIASGGVAVIAEVKKASPSRGVIRADYDPAAIARSYAAGDATCLSVLTDIDFFQGSDDDLQRARAACTLPVLRKDFIVDAWQVYEARALGADCVLLIVAILDDAQLADFAGLAASLGMDVLLESHDLAELQRALQVPVVDGHAPLLGINNRDLRSFVVSLDTTLDLLAQVPAGRRPVSESGIGTAMDVARLRAAGVDALLVGEAFMREEDPGAALQSLLGLA